MVYTLEKWKERKKLNLKLGSTQNNLKYQLDQLKREKKYLKSNKKKFLIQDYLLVYILMTKNRKVHIKSNLKWIEK